MGVLFASHDGAAAAAELLVVVRELLAVRRGGDDLVLEVARHFLRPIRGLDGGLERVAARVQAVELLDGLLDALEAAVRGCLGFVPIITLPGSYGFYELTLIGRD